ncbi:MAG: hypothetical protein U0324_26825 [Polyangiales bacterium]
MSSFASSAPKAASPSSPSPWARSALALALALSPAAASAQTLQSAFSEVVRGGLTTDAWGEVSTPTTFARGELRIQVPRGGRVRWARLFSGFTVYHDNARLPAWPPSVPAGPAGSPRQVIVGSGASAVTRALEGVPRFYASTVPTAGRTAYWGTFITDVTATVRAAVGPSSAGGLTRVAIQERGDDAAREDFARIQIGGHFLAVVYDLDFGPRRNVVVYEGAATSGFESAALPLPGAVANRCPTTGFARAEPFAAAIGVMWEFNRRPSPTAPDDPARDTCTEEESQIFVNGNNLTTHAGGADDWPSVAAGQGCFGDTAGLATMGTFGGTEPGAGRAAGSPVGLDGDEILTTPALPRLDDELYDFRTVVRDAATAMQFRFGTDGDEMIPVIAFQTLARVSTTDADGDSWLDTVEGDCTVDTDSDGTPDYLDTDSDNDCLPDMRESASGRTNPAVPGAPDLNCPATAPVCDRAAGVCLCNVDRDCGAATPVCDRASRTCVACASDAQCAALDPARPACSNAGASAGRCVPCTSSMHCRAPTPLCDVPSNTCVACLANRDCADPARPACDATSHACRPCAAATASTDCPDAGARACAVTGSNAGRCVQCVTNADCRTGVCDVATNRCVGCASDADCGGAAPVCDLTTRVCRPCDPARAADCRAPTPACAATGRDAGRCVQCTAADTRACTGATPACDPDSSRCVACGVGPMAAACAMSRDGTACVREMDGTVRCGCSVDSDCGAADSGRICDPSTRRCRPGCWPGAGHNGCARGEACSSNDPARPGVCARGCFRDDDCTQPTAYCIGSNSENAGRCVECINDTQCLGRRDGRTRCTTANVCAAPPPDAGAVQDGGCGCRARANTTGRFTLALFALALASLAARRRR